MWTGERVAPPPAGQRGDQEAVGPWGCPRRRRRPRTCTVPASRPSPWPQPAGCSAPEATRRSTLPCRRCHCPPDCTALLKAAMNRFDEAHLSNGASCRLRIAANSPDGGLGAGGRGRKALLHRLGGRGGLVPATGLALRVRKCTGRGGGYRVGACRACRSPVAARAALDRHLYVRHESGHSWGRWRGGGGGLVRALELWLIGTCACL